MSEYFYKFGKQQLPADNVVHVEDGFEIHYNGTDYTFEAIEKTPGRVFLVDSLGRHIFKWEMPVSVEKGEKFTISFNGGTGGYQPTLCYKNVFKN